ncbi:MAG: ADP-ribosylation/crystallin J1 [Kofleriaceae bacterium]|nr:ADP-ribosylation/crystallin J1 [Kofleriaceae bacterium]
MGEKDTTTLWRPVGQAELDLIAETEYRRFPPRLPEQPIFYPVCNEQYACEISEKWDARDQGVGYVTRFDVNTAFLAKYQTEIVGARHHEEYWIPAEELDAFNDAIIGKIEVVRTFKVGSD